MNSQIIEILNTLKSSGYNACIAGGMLRDKDLNYHIKDIDIFISHGDRDYDLDYIATLVDPCDVYRIAVYNQYNYMRDEVSRVIKFEAEDMTTIDVVITNCFSSQQTVQTFDSSLSHIYGIINDEGDDVNVYISTEYKKFKTLGKWYIYYNIQTTKRRVDYMEKRFGTENKVMVQDVPFGISWSFYKKLSEF